MARPPFRRSTDPFAVAEAAFKAATTKPAAPAPAAPKPAAIPGVKEQVTLRPRSGGAAPLPGGRPRLAGPDERGLAQGAGARRLTAPGSAAW